MSLQILLPIKESSDGDHNGNGDSLQLQPLLLPRRDSSRREWIRNFSDKSARRALTTQPSGVRGSGLLLATPTDYDLVEQAHIHGVIWPWNPYYRFWWHLTVLGAILTVFLAPYEIAFEEAPGILWKSADVLEKILSLVFTVDIILTFNLACYKENFIFERGQIVKEYLNFMFWVDLVGVIPFQKIALFCGRSLGSSNETDLMLSVLRLLHFVRLYRIKKLSDDLRYNARVSLLTFTLVRNFAAVVIMCHCQACSMYFLARLSDFSDDTWLGPIVHDSETGFERYITSLYWSITTFCTVGYGDFSPVNPSEKIAGSFFMLMNIVIAAWIIGSITLLIISGDEKSREYRESLETLHQYGKLNNFDQKLVNRLKEQLHLEFNNREIADEQVLKYFPNSVRRKILRRLYKEHLVNTKIMKGVRPQFVDAFLASCTVEIFSPGEEILERGLLSSDLFLLVGGIAEIATSKILYSFSEDTDHGESYVDHSHHHLSRLEAGDFIGEIGFFTESPQVFSVMSVTVCKMLTMSRKSYKLLIQDHPGSVGKILHNLLAKVESTSMQAKLPKPVEVLRAGSNLGYQSVEECPDLGLENESIFQRRNEPLTAVKDLVTMHMRRNRDDETTRLLFAASRGDTNAISLMCDHGFDPNNSDYDNRTALMVASMKGNADAAKLLLQYNACPNKTDMHGSSALLEATKNGHDDIMDLLFQYGASLCMPESQAASILCQAVFDGDILLLKRLLKTGIDINSADYDKRTASHVAAAEGNVAAIRILAERGADLTLPDRWGNTVEDEARRSNAHQLLVFLDRRSEAFQLRR